MGHWQISLGLYVVYNILHIIYCYSHVSCIIVYYYGYSQLILSYFVMLSVEKHCLSGWTGYESLCYYTSRSTSGNWSTGLRYCQSFGATLASATSDGEMEFLSNMMYENFTVVRSMVSILLYFLAPVKLSRY